MFVHWIVASWSLLMERDINSSKPVMQKGEWTCCPTWLIIKLHICRGWWTLENMWPATMLTPANSACVYVLVILPQLDVWLLMKSRCFQACGVFAPLPLTLSIHSTLKGHLLCGLMALQSTKLPSNPAASALVWYYVIVFCMFVPTLAPAACKYVFVWLDFGGIVTTQVFAVVCCDESVSIVTASLIWPCVFPPQMAGDDHR